MVCALFICLFAPNVLSSIFLKLCICNVSSWFMQMCKPSIFYYHVFVPCLVTWQLTFCCSFFLKDEDKICYGCAKQGSVDMKHPDPCKYDGGHLDMGRPFECVDEWSDSEDDAEYV